MEPISHQPKDVITGIKRNGRSGYAWLPPRNPVKYPNDVSHLEVRHPVGAEAMLAIFQAEEKVKALNPLEREAIVAKARENQERITTFVQKGGYLTDSGVLFGTEGVVAPAVNRRPPVPVADVIKEKGLAHFSSASSVQRNGKPVEAEGGIWFIPENFGESLSIRWFTGSPGNKGGLQITTSSGNEVDLDHAFVYALGASIDASFAEAGIKPYISATNFARQTLTSVALANMRAPQQAGK